MEVERGENRKEGRKIRKNGESLRKWKRGVREREKLDLGGRE
jgi:hypothetical protein